MASISSEFVKADSTNLPTVDIFMISEFLKDNECFNIAEVRGAKAQSASRESYGDSAVGYVQLKREQNICILKGRITPEHKVRSKAYSVQVKIDEDEEKILEILCEDCAASLGGCKHALAFLMWIHRRSEEPSPTEVQCYWTKSKLSCVGSTLKFIKAVDLGKQKTSSKSTDPNPTDFLYNVIAHAKTNLLDSQLSRHNFDLEDDLLKNYSIHRLCMKFVESGEKTLNAENFRKYMQTEIRELVCWKLEAETKNQNENHLWHEMRYGRITASIIHTAAQCKSFDGALVQQILGGVKIPDTAAMKRGRTLEKQVIQCAEKQLKKEIKSCGFYLSSLQPVIGASPDGICDDFIVEVKCPTTMKTKENYVSKGVIQPKVFAQMHTQMYACHLQKGLLCVAHPDFEINQNVELIFIDFDEIYFENLIKMAVQFWDSAIFPKIIKSVQK